MVRSCITISLVPEARGGPFIFWDDLPAACRKAKALGFHAVEIFAPSPDAVNRGELRRLLNDLELRLGAVGTGAGWVKHRLSLIGPDAATRQKAKDFVRGMIDFGGEFSAPAIIGSMQGRWSDDMGRVPAMKLVGEALAELGAHATQYGAPLLFEPLNRYETNLINTVSDGSQLIDAANANNVTLLCDLFHMNIEEQDIAASLREAGTKLGHVHLADSNRRPAGCGHVDYAPIAAALHEMEYAGCLSAECLPYPDSDQAARLTIQAYRRFFGSC